MEATTTAPEPITAAAARAMVFDMLAATAHDPEAFVRMAFQWGEPGTDLEKFTGPLAWQTESMAGIKRHLSDSSTMYTPYLEAIASGHGIGKSADVAWMILWAFMTKANTRGVVTANTMAQLISKTWAELATWFNRLIKPIRDIFVMEATSLHAKGSSAKTWRIDAHPWSKQKTEAFAGLHNQGKRILVVFDEASAIEDVIWEVTEGALTDKDTEILWLVRGNPTRNTGRFRECFAGGKHAQSWRSRKIDSRTVEITNKTQLNSWLTTYGEDSDFYRVRVRGEFPSANFNQLIPVELVDQAMKRPVSFIASDPVVWGIDVARFGGDESVLAKRRGRDAKSRPWKHWRGLDTMTLAQEILTEYQNARLLQEQPDAIFVDEGGLGGPLVDRLRQLNVPNVFGINFGGAERLVQLPGDVSMRVFNPTAAMWVETREWLREGGAIPEDDHELKAQLTERLYGFTTRNNALQLESKEDIRNDGSGRSSPDRADALSLTFAMPVAPRQVGNFANPQSGVTNNYDIHADLRR